MSGPEQYQDADGAFGPQPRLYGGSRRPRLMLRSSNDNEARRNLRRAFKGGLSPIRSAAREAELDWRLRSRIVSAPEAPAPPVVTVEERGLAAAFRRAFKRGAPS